MVTGGGGAAVGSEASAIEDAVGDLPSEEPYVTEEPTGPEAELDALAAAKGWEVDDGMYFSASDFVTKVCDRLPTEEVTEESRPQWLAEGLLFWDDGKEVLLAGIPKLCPEWTDEV